MTELPSITGAGRGARIARVALLALGQAACIGMVAFATRDVFAALAGAEGLVPWAALGAIALGGIAIAVLRVAERIVAERLGQDYAAELRLLIFRHLSGMRSSAIGRRRNGALALRFVGDLAAVRNWISRGVARLISSAIILPTVGVVLILLDPRIALVALPLIALSLVAMVAIRRPLGRAHQRLRRRRSRLAADMSERAPHAPGLRLLGREGIERRLIRKRSEALADAAVRRTQIAAILRAMPEIASSLAAAGVLIVCFAGYLPAAVAAGSLAVIGLATTALRDLCSVIDARGAWVAARSKCIALLEMPTEKPRRRKPPRPVSRKTVLRFEDVSCGAIRGFTGELKRGEQIALMGPNGSGKSTLLALAAGLEVPDAGRVLIEGRPLIKLRPSDRRRKIAFVSAASPILAGSLRRALRMGAGPAEDAALLDMAYRCGLGAVLDRLGGLDGRIAEGGRNLSAGEAWRVRIARAMLAQPALCLMDEPDAALGPDGLEPIMSLLSEKRTSCVIATHSATLAARLTGTWKLEPQTTGLPPVRELRAISPNGCAPHTLSASD